MSAQPLRQLALGPLVPVTHPRRLHQVRRVTPRLSADAIAIRKLLELHAAPNPATLDCGCNEQRIWKGLPYPRTTLDRNPAFEPDVVGDWNDLPALFLDRRFDVIVWDPPHQPNTGRNAMGGKWVKKFGLGDDDLRGFKNIHHLFPPFLTAAKAVLVPKTGIVLAKIADIVHADERHWTDAAFVTAARAAGLVPCDRMLGSQVSPPPQHERQYHAPSLTFWIVLHNGRACRGPGVARWLTCHSCHVPFKARRRDAKTCSDKCRTRYRRAGGTA